MQRLEHSGWQCNALAHRPCDNKRKVRGVGPAPEQPTSLQRQPGIAEDEGKCREDGASQCEEEQGEYPESIKRVRRY